MTVVGGIRSRLIRDSFYEWVKAGVIARGWTDPGRKHTPISFIPTPGDWNVEVPLNSIAVTPEDVFDDEAEMGSSLTDDTWTFYIDLYAESDHLGLDLAHDIRDLLRGKMPSIGYTRQGFDVLDYQLATPAPLFFCEIQNVTVDRARNFPQAWKRYWFSIRCDVLDTYMDETDS